MRILFLSRWFPFPMNNGSKLRIYNLLRELREHHDITLLSFADQTEVNREAPELRSICSDVHVVPWREFNAHSFQAYLGFLSLKPRSITDTFSVEMIQKITRLINTEKYDLVIASQLPMAAYCRYFKGLPAMFEELELGLSSRTSDLTFAPYRHLRHALTWFKLRLYLSQLLKHFETVTVVSEQERDLTLKKFPFVRNICVIPNCINLADYNGIQAKTGSSRLIFTGSFRYHANYEAMCWFIREVFSLVLEQMPEVELLITGDHADLPLPLEKNINLTGYVDDIKPLIASSTVVLAPLRSGGGTRLKILEAMAMGIPVVATSKGAEGLEVHSGEHLYIADDPVEFSACVITLLRDAGLRDQMAKRARSVLQDKYVWEKTAPHFMKLVEDTVINYRWA